MAATETLTDAEHLKLIAILARPKGEEALLLFMGRMSLYKALQLHNDGTPKYRLSPRVYKQIKEALITIR